jgi:DNA polymerase III epsilon subunit-like protein
MADTNYPLIKKLAEALNKPILIFDLETTGLMNKLPVGIVEIAILVILPDGKLKSFLRRVHPGMKIPSIATGVHHIKDSDVINLDKFDKLIPILKNQFKNCIISGFNSNSYDIPVLEHNFDRYNDDTKVSIDRIDVRSIWTKYSKSRKGTLTYVSDFLNVPSGTAHSALGDIQTTANIFEKLLELIGLENFIKNYITIKPVNAPSGYIDNSNDVKAPDNTKKTWDKRKVELMPIIQDYISQTQTILLVDMEIIAKKANISVNAVSFALSDMLDKNILKIENLIDNSQQKVIHKYFPETLKAIGSTSKLAPLKTHLDTISKSTIDYIQLKIYLKQNRH